MPTVLYLVHGVGRHGKTWSKDVVRTIKESANGLQDDPDTGFEQEKLKGAIADTEFVQLWYDDFLQESVQQMLEKEEDFIKALNDFIKPLNNYIERFVFFI